MNIKKDKPHVIKNLLELHNTVISCSYVEFWGIENVKAAIEKEIKEKVSIRKVVPEHGSPNEYNRAPKSEPPYYIIEIE